MNYITTDAELTSIADAIRAKGGTSASLVYPSGFISAINDISGGGEGAKAFIEQSFPDGQVIDNTASYVGGSAFYQRPVTYVSLGAVTEIRSNAFYYCIGLESVCCPECTLIERNAFQYCSSLKRVTSDSFPKCTSMHSLAFAYLRDLEILELPALQSIVSYTGENFYGAFQSCYNLSYVDIGSLSFVPRSWFANCSSLAEVHATNLTEIKEYAFYYCNSLSSIDITNVSSFGSYAFYYCALSGHITIDPATHTYSSACLCGNNFTTASYIGYSIVPSILSGNSYLYSVDVGSATSLASAAFAGCRALSSLSFVITGAGSSALMSCGFSKVPSNTLTYMPYAFLSGCSKLEEVSSADFSFSEYAASWAFAYCTSLSRFEMSGTVVSPNAFRSCVGLTDVSMPNVTQVWSYAFHGCGFSEVSFPKLVNVYSAGFASCASLREIRIGTRNGSRVVFSSYAFQNCTNLVSLYLYGGRYNSIAYLYSTNVFQSTPIWGYSASAGRLGNVYVPSDLLNNYKQDVYWGQISDRIFAIPDDEY